jgi:hypothetical protein
MTAVLSLDSQADIVQQAMVQAWPHARLDAEPGAYAGRQAA